MMMMILKLKLKTQDNCSIMQCCNMLIANRCLILPDNDAYFYSFFVRLPRSLVTVVQCILYTGAVLDRISINY